MSFQTTTCATSARLLRTPSEIAPKWMGICSISCGDILLLRVRGALESEFIMRFQQFTSPVMAKGVEDTVFYSYTRLLSLNEVGGNAGRFGISPRAFHDFCLNTQKSHPRTMLASSTHDTK